MSKASLDEQLDSVADARAVEISPAMLERGRHEAIAFLARPFGVDCFQRVAIISIRASADRTEAKDNQGDEREKN